MPCPPFDPPRPRPPAPTRWRASTSGTALLPPDWQRPIPPLFKLFLLACAALLALPALASDAAPSTEQARLIRMVQQDCGSCHGIQLTGGLGPALTRERMADFPYDSLVAVIYHGRPGTPMPGWKSMISEADAHWIARALQAGFPLPTAPPPLSP